MKKNKKGKLHLFYSLNDKVCYGVDSMLSCVTIQNRKGINYPCLVGDLEGMSNKSEESKLMPKQTTGKKSKQGNNETNKSIENSNLSTEDTDRACKMVRRRTKQTRCFLRELHIYNSCIL